MFLSVTSNNARFRQGFKDNSSIQRDLQNVFWSTPKESEGVAFFPENEDLHRNLATLDEIKSLPANWDGCGAQGFSQFLLLTVNQILRGLRVQPEVFPTARQSLQLEYHKGADYLEFEIFKNLRVNKFQFIDGQASQELDIPSTSIDTIVREFYELV